MGKGGTKFEGEAIGVRGKVKTGLTGKEMRKNMVRAGARIAGRGWRFFGGEHRGRRAWPVLGRGCGGIAGACPACRRPGMRARGGRCESC